MTSQQQPTYEVAVVELVATQRTLYIAYLLVDRHDVTEHVLSVGKPGGD